MLCYVLLNILYNININRTLYEHLNNLASGKVC